MQRKGGQEARKPARGRPRTSHAKLPSREKAPQFYLTFCGVMMPLFGFPAGERTSHQKLKDILVDIPSTQRRLTIEHSIGADGITTLICKGRINVESAGLLRNEVKACRPAIRRCWPI